MAGDTQPPAGQAPPAAPPTPPAGPAGLRANNTLTVIAGVGVLLLAMGVGVLIGRSGASKQSAPAAQVISVASGAATGTSGAAEASFSGEWPSGTSGYTVQLQTLPATGTALSAVAAAKAAASAKGAKAVGALKSDEFSSLTAGSFVIYSGVYHNRAEAEKALGALKKSFPSAAVIHVSNSGSSAGAPGGGGSSSGGGGVGSSPTKPAPPSVLEGLKGAKGKSYEEKSKNLPDVVETG